MFLGWLVSKLVWKKKLTSSDIPNRAFIRLGFLTNSSYCFPFSPTYSYKKNINTPVVHARDSSSHCWGQVMCCAKFLYIELDLEIETYSSDRVGWGIVGKVFGIEPKWFSKPIKPQNQNWSMLQKPAVDFNNVYQCLNLWKKFIFYSFSSK